MQSKTLSTLKCCHIQYVLNASNIIESIFLYQTYSKRMKKNEIITHDPLLLIVKREKWNKITREKSVEERVT